jgi:hypothetical protein
MKTITWCHSGSSRMGNIKYKDEMELIYMLIDLTGIRNIREQDEPDIWYNVECGSTKTH